MFGPKQLVDVLSRLFRWNRPPPKKQIYKIVPDDDDLEAPSASGPDAGHIKFDWHKTPRAKTRALQAAEKAAKSAERKCCQGSGTSFLVFALLVSLLLSLTYIGKLHSSPGCGCRGGRGRLPARHCFQNHCEQHPDAAPEGRDVPPGTPRRADASSWDNDERRLRWRSARC